MADYFYYMEQEKRLAELKKRDREIESLRTQLAASRRATNDALEAAARVCDDLHETGWNGCSLDGMRIAAERIRALKERT